MPCKNQKAITLSFSKKNEDVAHIIQKYKENERGFIQNDYVCEAIRFYEKYKNNKFNSNTLQKEEILNLVDNRVKELLENNSLIEETIEKDNINIILENKANDLTDDDLEED